MIIKIKQIKTNLKMEFDIDYDKQFKYNAKASWISSMEKCALIKPDGETLLQTNYDFKTNIKNSISLKALISYPKQSRFCNVVDNDGTKIGTIMYAKRGLFKTMYNISFGNQLFDCYSLCRGSYDYVSIYLNNVQVAMIEKNLSTYNNLDEYKIYLLDDYVKNADILALFTIYYDNWNYSNKGEIVIEKSKTIFEYSLSRYSKMYNPNWLDEHFENRYSWWKE